MQVDQMLHRLVPAYKRRRLERERWRVSLVSLVPAWMREIAALREQPPITIGAGVSRSDVVDAINAAVRSRSGSDGARAYGEGHSAVAHETETAPVPAADLPTNATPELPPATPTGQ